MSACVLGEGAVFAGHERIPAARHRVRALPIWPHPDTVYMRRPGRGLGAAPLAPADCTLLNAAHLRFAPSAG
jgi:hypothetical protein